GLARVAHPTSGGGQRRPRRVCVVRAGWLAPVAPRPAPALDAGPAAHEDAVTCTDVVLGNLRAASDAVTTQLLLMRVGRVLGVPASRAVRAYQAAEALASLVGLAAPLCGPRSPGPDIDAEA